MPAILQRRQVPPGQMVYEVVDKDVQRVKQAVERNFARCGKAQTVTDFLDCIDGLGHPVREVARAVVIVALRNKGMQYPTWEALRADARNIPYKILLDQLGVPQASVTSAQTSTSATSASVTSAQTSTSATSAYRQGSVYYEVP